MLHVVAAAEAENLNAIALGVHSADVPRQAKCKSKTNRCAFELAHTLNKSVRMHELTFQLAR